MVLANFQRCQNVSLNLNKLITEADIFALRNFISGGTRGIVSAKFTIRRTSSFEHSVRKHILLFYCLLTCYHKDLPHPLFQSLYVRQQWKRRAVCSALQTSHTSNAFFQVLVPDLSHCSVGLGAVFVLFAWQRTTSRRDSKLKTYEWPFAGRTVRWPALDKDGLGGTTHCSGSDSGELTVWSSAGRRWAQASAV